MLHSHELGEALRFHTDPTGLTRAVIRTPAAIGELYLHGAHVTAWQPDGTGPVLFMSSKSLFADGKPIRGGVPICFPWFGPHPTDAAAPMHGLVRTRAWDLLDTAAAGDDVTLRLQTRLDALRVTFAATFGRSLTLALTAENISSTPQPISEALHTYLAVSDVRRVHVTGLRGVTYHSKTQNNQRFTESADELRLAERTDRVYLATESTCVLHDPDLRRRILVEKQGSRSTVIWNIGQTHVHTLADMGEQDWPRYLCIESANALDDACTLAPGQSHTLTQTLRVEPMG